MNQTKNVLSYLKKYGSITPMIALRTLQCFRLAARIHELKTEGYKILAEIKTDKRKHKRWAEYTLVRK
jgi:hypothetical protein